MVEYITSNTDPASLPNKKYVACLKWGKKYNAKYVNNLHNMVKRNLTIDYEFICFTDDASDIDQDITVRNLTAMPLSGWWYKPWFLSDELGIHGTLLFLDLDLIVFKNINYLFDFESTSDFIIIRDFNRSIRPNWDRMNSSVFRVNIGKFDYLWKTFKRDFINITRQHQGDQDWMYKSIKTHKFWPDEWIQSYKWEMRGRSELVLINGKRTFKTAGTPILLPNTSIAVFHGEPNIPDCIDEWTRKHWY